MHVCVCVSVCVCVCVRACTHIQVHSELRRLRTLLDNDMPARPHSARGQQQRAGAFNTPQSLVRQERLRDFISKAKHQISAGRSPREWALSQSITSGGVSDVDGDGTLKEEEEEEKEEEEEEGLLQKARGRSSEDLMGASERTRPPAHTIAQGPHDQYAFVLRPHTDSRTAKDAEKKTRVLRDAATHEPPRAGGVYEASYRVATPLQGVQGQQVTPQIVSEERAPVYDAAAQVAKMVAKAKAEDEQDMIESARRRASVRSPPQSIEGWEGENVSELQDMVHYVGADGHASGQAAGGQAVAVVGGVQLQRSAVHAQAPSAGALVGRFYRASRSLSLL
jgi:hypothetical protein